MNNQKVLIINGSMPHRQPHVDIYLRLLEQTKTPFDVICWNRKGDDISNIPSNYIVYNRPTDDNFPFWKKIVECQKFANFVEKNTRDGIYKGAIVFTIVTAIFSYDLLKKEFSHRYIFDIRDWSPIIKTLFGKLMINRLIKYSYHTSISSEGFLQWLPKDFEYIISHNIDERKLIEENPFSTTFDSKKLRVLTIGSLRDEVTNSYVISELGNDERFQLNFVGDGVAVPILLNYCSHNCIKNVNFHGYYQKEEEDSFIKDCELMNVYLPNNMLSNYLMTNRFYLSVLFRKPMIVNEGSFQADMVAKYGLGLIVNRNQNMKTQILNYIKLFDVQEYESGCRAFLDMVKKHVTMFNHKTTSFIITPNNKS